MDNARQTLDPSGWMDLIDSAFYGALASQGHGDALSEIEEQVGDMTDSIGHLVTNRMDAANAHFAVLATAGAAVLEPRCGQDASAELVSDALNGPFRKDILAGTRAMLDAANDPYAALVAASRQREESWFGSSFGFERPLDDGDTYVLDVRRCLFHDVLVALGRPDLQAILCHFDLNWVDAVEPERHGAVFIRPVTFSCGERCRMVFSRVERPTT